MDILNQTKLSRAEWKSIEEPISTQEKNIVSLIKSGYHDVNIKTNGALTMTTFCKMEHSSEMDLYLYQRFLKSEIQTILEKYGTIPNSVFSPLKFSVKENAIKRMKSVDLMRIKNLESNITENRNKIFEFILLDFFKIILKNIYKIENTKTDKKSKPDKNEPYFSLYTIIQLKKNTILHINHHMMEFWDVIISYGKLYTRIEDILLNADEIVEKNKNILKYEDLSLFSHQKELFSFCRINKETPKLVLYIAPTGTGKTLSPIGLSDGYRILFVCVARHVGLALAKSAISMEKKVAFAFGCETASDIRLHYFSAVDYTINKRSGGIGKVDNSNGINVEIMICDVQSYLIAMYYMLGFNEEKKMLTYWDEPTITMDYETHSLHEVISKNWKENRIPNMVMSCATLPNEEEIPGTMMDFRCRFPNAEIKTITSYDCKKSIPILNKDGYCMLPHLMYSEIEKIIECAKFCENNKTLLRYFELSEIIRFLNYISPLTKEVKPKSYDINLVQPYRIPDYFTDIREITMNSLKIYYLEILKNMDKFIKEPTIWTELHNHLKDTQEKKFGEYSITKSAGQEGRSVEGDTLRRTQSMQDTSASVSGGNIKKINSYTSIATISKPKHVVPEGAQGILLTTVDAHTLTDGPTIFLAEEIDKIGKFYVNTSKIPDGMLQNITNTIIQNDKILREIEKFDDEIEKKLQVKDNSDKSGGDVSKTKNEKKSWDVETENLMDKISGLRKKIQMVSMDPNYIPNTIPHQKIWLGDKNIKSNVFVPNVEEETVREIMQLDIDRTFKILVLLGIGVLLKQENSQYEEIVKRLANEQRLFITLASTDYIYGTNYAYCHGMIGKDLQKMTPQKTLQAMGRIGRNNIQQEYTIRFRDDDMITRLFTKPEINMEAIVMERLFSSI